MNKQLIETLAYWINERDHIRQQKEANMPLPWTDDPILGTYRFCNVHRDDDAVTQFIKFKWLPQFPLVRRTLAAVAGRLFNRPDVLQHITKPLQRTDLAAVHKALHEYREAGNKTFNAAYIITTCGVKMDKLYYCVDRVMRDAMTLRKPSNSDTLTSYARLLTTVHGLNSFLAAQVIADLRFFKPLDTATDLETFALSGPGSRRGLNRIYDRPITKGWKEEEWHKHLRMLRVALLPMLGSHVGDLHCQDLQNCLCEFDKYMRTKNGEGRPKQKYTPKSQLPGVA